MIVSAIIELVTGLLGLAFDVLPTSTLGFPELVLDWAEELGTKGGPWQGFFPIIDMLNVLADIVGIMFPLVLTYKLANWTYKHIPQLGGFGPGSG